MARNLPVVVYEEGGFGVTQDMIDSMHIPKEVQDFNIAGFLQGLGYQRMPNQPSRSDVVWLPPNHVLLEESRGQYRRLL